MRSIRPRLVSVIGRFQRLGHRVSCWRCLHRPKVMFVILAKYRVGSNYLSSLLRAHREIELGDELFNISSLCRNPKRVRQPQAFLKEYLSACGRRCTAKGFKLMYNHLSTFEFDRGNWPSYISRRIEQDLRTLNQVTQQPLSEVQKGFDDALAHLTSHSAFRIIHLKRRNILETLISSKRAFLEDNWVYNPSGTKPIELTANECESFFQETIRQQAHYDALFSRAPVFNIDYEDLVGQTEANLTELLRFLGVREGGVLRSSLKKQSRQGPASQVSNYRPLKHHFEGTRWAAFFE